MADQYDTALSEAEESKFQVWKELHYPNDSGYDYDLRGAFKAGMKPDPETGHGDDLFKKPNHPTFSIYSKWAKDFPEKAGTWDGDTYIPHPKPKKFGDGGSANLPPEQDESLIDMATRYGQGVMRKHPVITRGLASIVTDPLDLLQFLAMHGSEDGLVAPNQIETPEQLTARHNAASSIPNAGELAQKYLAQAGVRESETLPEQLGELGVGLMGPALLAKGPKAFSWGKRILGMMDLPKATALTKASGGPVHMGKGGLLKAGAEELVELAAKYLPKAEKVIPNGDSMSKTPNRVRIPHEIDPEKLRDVISEMKKFGRPKIDVVDTGEEYLALEGSHRLTAAHKLGMKPIYNVVDQESIIDPKAYDVDTYNFKWDDNEPHTAGEMAWEMHGDGRSPQLDFIKARGGPIRKASGGLSRVNESGNYTKPGMRKQLFNSIKARAVQGTGAGQWSARKAQLLAKSYKEKGGGYTD
jgi:hypothetical protein